MAGIKIVDLPALGRDLISTDLLELSLAGGTGSRKITGQEIMNASKLSVGNTPIINGAGGQVLFQGAGNVLQESANFTWDNSNQTLYLGGALSFGGNTDQIKASSGSGNFDFLSNLPMRFLRKSGPVELMRIVSSTGNVLINTTTDAGFKFDVNGTAIFRSNITLNSNALYIGANSAMSLSTASSDIYLSNGNTSRKIIFDLTGSGQFQFNNGNVLIGTTTDAGFKLDVNGTARVVGNTLLDSGIIATSTATTRLQGSLNYFTHNRIASSGAFGFQIGNFGTITSFWRWDAATYDMEIGLPSGALSQSFKLFTAGSERMRLTAGGNVLIGTTTDAGFKLDVNGTARFTGRIDAGTFTPGAAAALYTIATTGRINAAGGIYFRTPIVGDTSLTGFNSSSNDTQINVQVGNVNMFYFSGAGGSTAPIAVATPNFNPSSGTGDKAIFQVAGTYQTSGTYSGAIRGFYYNPTLTSMTGVTAHWAFHSTSGRIRFENLPTSPTGLNAGDLYNNLGVLMIV